MRTEPSSASWDRVRALYGQCSQILGDIEGGSQVNYLPPELTSELAKRLGDLALAFRGREHEMIDEVLACFARVDSETVARMTDAERFRHFYADTRFRPLPEYGTAVERRRPRPFEAVVETCRRLDYLERMRMQLRGADDHGGGWDIPCACVLGGSASYGPFYNTIGAGNNKPSDLDLLLVVQSYDVLGDIVGELRRLPGTTKANLDAIAARAEDFPAVRASRPDGESCMFSDKVTVWSDEADPVLAKAHLPGWFGVSINVFDQDDFATLVLAGAPSIDSAAACHLWDFKSREPRKHSYERCFAGLVCKTDTHWREDPHPYAVRRHVFQMHEDRFYPGLHQNMVLPCFDLRWEAEAVQVKPLLDNFKIKVQERLREERRLHPDDVQYVSLSHTRSSVFAPHIVKRVNSAD